MKEPVAGAARAEQRHVERREGRAHARAGDEGERDDGGLAGILLGPAPRAAQGARQRRRQARGRSRGARRVRGLIVVAPRFTEPVLRFLFGLGGGIGGARAGGFSGGAGGVYDFTGFFFNAG